MPPPGVIGRIIADGGNDVGDARRRRKNRVATSRFANSPFQYFKNMDSVINGFTGGAGGVPGALPAAAAVDDAVESY